jgi:hypothetical protein
MRIPICLALAASLFCSPLKLCAQQQEVILKSGTNIVGDVSIEGSDAVVQVADKKVRVPLKDVATISAVDFGRQEQARRLLVAALEAKLTHNAGKEVVGMLAEAKRLAPDDPSIAYWYASCLADAGHGRAAKEMLESHRDAIAKVYPGMIDRLAARIKNRIEMEKLPPELVQRIDALSAAANVQSTTGERRQYYAMFRLSDQDKHPVDQSSFRLDTNSQEQNIERFDDGYFVVTMTRYRGTQDQPCRIEILEPGLEAKTFQFTPSSTRVADAGEFSVRRYDDSAKKALRIRVVGSDGEAVPGAQINLQAMSARGGVAAESLAATTGIDGRTELALFPAKYMMRVQATGFVYYNTNVELTPFTGKLEERQITIDRIIQATIRVAWQSTTPQGGKTSGVAKLRTNNAGQMAERYSADTPMWIRTNQMKDRLMLQFIEMYGGSRQMNSPSWMRVISADAPAKDDRKNAGMEKFDSIDLDKIDELKEKGAAPEASPNQPGTYPGAIIVPAERGKVYVGKMQQRDMRNGQMVEMSFKAVVEEMSGDVEKSDKRK